MVDRSTADRNQHIWKQYPDAFRAFEAMANLMFEKGKEKTTFTPDERRQLAALVVRTDRARTCGDQTISVTDFFDAGRRVAEKSQLSIPTRVIVARIEKARMAAEAMPIEETVGALMTCPRASWGKLTDNDIEAVGSDLARLIDYLKKGGSLAPIEKVLERGWLSENLYRVFAGRLELFAERVKKEKRGFLARLPELHYALTERFYAERIAAPAEGLRQGTVDVKALTRTRNRDLGEFFDLVGFRPYQVDPNGFEKGVDAAHI